MGQQDELGVVVAALLSPVAQPGVPLTGESATVHPIVPTPVVWELEEVLTRDYVEPVADCLGDSAITVDLPQPRYEVQVGQKPGGRNSVAEVVGGVVVSVET